MLPLTKLWADTLAQVGVILSQNLEHAGVPTFAHPNTLIASFPPEHKAEYEFCRDPARTGRVQDALRRITGLEWTLIVQHEWDEWGPNCGSLTSVGRIEHDGLRFRSKTETRIYDALKQKDILFFPNPAAILGKRTVKREPDFLICFGGKWGILEVMGDQYHNVTSAVVDHDRARLFKDYGLYFIEFYDANKCYNQPNEVVEDFLSRLAKF